MHTFMLCMITTCVRLQFMMLIGDDAYSRCLFSTMVILVLATVRAISVQRAHGHHTFNG
jgi:hypothetical protein